MANLASQPDFSVKALYTAANKASRQAAVADHQQYWSSQLAMAQVQHNMRKSNPHSAHIWLNQLGFELAELIEAIVT